VKGGIRDGEEGSKGREEEGGEEKVAGPLYGVIAVR
jgi:hypothetical protein